MTECSKLINNITWYLVNKVLTQVFLYCSISGACIERVSRMPDFISIHQVLMHWFNFKFIQFYTSVLYSTSYKAVPVLLFLCSTLTLCFSSYSLPGTPSLNKKWAKAMQQNALKLWVFLFDTWTGICSYVYQLYSA